LFAGAAFGWLASAPAADDHLGRVDFPTTCSPAVQPLIEKGAALLHSFQYMQSEKTFTEAAQQDPNCAMAHWGKAMALYHQLWDFRIRKTLEEGRKELDKAKKQKHISPREKGFIETAQVFFQKNDKLDKKGTNRRLFRPRWKSGTPAFSSDVEVGSFYALSLVALAYEEDAGEALELRRKAIGVLNPLFEQHPDHPGVAH